MVLPSSKKVIALASLVFTFLFFFEYIPPIRWVHIPYDLHDYHFSLADYAFLRLREGQFPLWDPTIYCGMSFVSNVQTALFYPPTWLLFLFNLGRERLSYQSMQDLVFAHVWIAFLLCYIWLRAKRLGELSCALGAGVFAFNGYVCSQLQHFGMVCGYVWIPLALWGIDEAGERRSWKPLWKVAAASALSFLAGYPPTWMVFATAVGAYSLAGLWRWKAALGTIAALVFSLILSAVQVLPAWEATALREPELRYGDGVKNPDEVLSYLLPNYFDFDMNKPAYANPLADYFYLGVPAVLGLPFLIRRRTRDLNPSLAMLAASVVMAVNPFNIVGAFIRHSTLLPDVLRSWYFLAGVPAAFAPLTAYAMDGLFAKKGRPVPAWLAPVNVGFMAIWSGYELYRWRSQSFASGWRSGIDLLVTLAIFGIGIYAVRAAQGRRRVWLAAAILLFVGIDYKAYGTSKRFNGMGGDAVRFSSTSLPGVPDDAYQQLRAGTGYRIAVDNDTGPLPNDFRHMGLATPQGFDPFLTIRLRKTVTENEHFRTDRTFDIDPANEDALKLLGVRYFISSEPSPTFPKLRDSPRFRRVGSTQTFNRVFEYLDPHPAFSWEGGGSNDLLHREMWEPEQRTFQVLTSAGGKLALHEQFFPGWTATIDGKSAAVERWMGAFQAVSVPAGEHTVEFRYRSRLLGWGGGISLMALITLIAWIRVNSRSKSDTAYRAVSE